MKLQIIKTSDGSSSLYNVELDETYHSRHGSVNEANHVFIRTGLEYISKSSETIRILEIGFGTGLNAWLTVDFFKNHPDKKGSYHGIENTPISADIINELDYSIEDLDLFHDMHKQPWEKANFLIENLSILKNQADFLTMDLQKNRYDLVYFDAFGPRAQESMWDLKNFKKLFESMSSGGIIVTYCAKGQVRRDMETVGFNMERLPGPPGKREMLRGTKPA